MATYTGVSFSTVSVYTDSSHPGTLSTIYSDAGMTIQTANPFPCFGNYTFYAAADQYVMQGDLTKLLPAGVGTFANLPANPAIGTIRAVLDDTTAVAWGSTAAGGGANIVLVWWNGTNWTIIGK